MKYFKYILLPLSLLLLLATACSEDEEKGGTGHGEFSLTLNIPGAQLSKATDPNAKPGEHTITNVYLLFYAEDAADNALPAMFYKETDISVESTWSRNFSEVYMSGLQTDVAYDVYALASLPAGTEAPTAQTGKGDLLALREKQFARTAAEPALSFSGTAKYTGASKQSMEIDLTRTVARFDITFVDAPANTAIEIQNSPLYTFYQPGHAAATERMMQAPIKIDDNTYRYYAYENIEGAEAIRIYTKASTANGEEVVYLADVNGKNKNVIERNYIYSVEMTFKPEGSVNVTCTAIPWEEQTEVPVTPETDLFQPKANAYMVAPGSEAIYIPVAQANDAPDIPAIGDTEWLTAELVWTDAIGTGTTPGLAPDASVAEIAVIGSGPTAALKVTPGSKQGNAVVAVKGKDGIVKWSWHIWVTDYDPDKTENGYGSCVMGGDVFMDRNLGALTSTPNVDGDGIVGNFYQWGRKDPFPAVTATGFVKVYDAAGKEVAKTTNIASDIPALVKNPFGWTAATTYYTDQLWGNDGTNTVIGDKSVYDPCPAGWRVPRMDAYADLCSENFSVENATGWAGRKGFRTGFFPKTGYVHNGVHNNNNYIYMWTSLRTYWWRAAGTSADGTVKEGNGAANGFPVRCVKDFRERPDNEVRILNYAANNNLLSLTYWLDNINMPLSPGSQGNSVKGFREFITQYFSPERPVNATFRFYNTNTAGKLIAYLEKYDINVLYIYFQSPALSDDLAADVLAWLAKDKHRVLVLDLDGAGQTNLAKAMGLGPLSGASVPQNLLPANNDAPIYKQIMAGPYGEITSPTLPSVNNGWAVAKSAAEEAGFVPVFYNEGNKDQILVAVHPDKRMVFWSDSQYFGSTFGGPYNAFGLVTNEKYKDYPVWGANLWTWIVNQALDADY